MVASSGAKTKLRNMSDSISLFDMEELEVAKQLTLRTWDIYSKFQVRRPVSQRWDVRFSYNAPLTLIMINSPPPK